MMKLNEIYNNNGRTGIIIFIGEHFFTLQYHNGTRDTVNLVNPLLIAKETDDFIDDHRSKYTITEDKIIMNLLCERKNFWYIADVLRKTETSVKCRVLKLLGTRGLKKAWELVTT